MLLFFDIDGTIWDYRNFIPESTIDAIRQARANGHQCFLNSGRSRAFIYNEDLLGIGFDGIVSACGCMIEHHGKVVFNKLIDREDCIRTVETVRKYHFKPILEGPEYLYMERSDFEGDMYGEKVMKEMGDHLLGIDDCWGKWEMNKLSCDTRDTDYNSCYRELDDIYDFMIHNPIVVEMVPKGHNKGTGIAKVCELLGEDIENTIAFGDSINDKEMLEAAGIGVAMGNGTDVIKELADHVTTPLLDNGVYNGLKSYNII